MAALGYPGNFTSAYVTDMLSDLSNVTTPLTKTSDSNMGQPSMLTRYIFETGLCMPISVLGLLGNILAGVVLIRQRPRLSTTVVLLGLAVADSLVLLTTILLRSLRYFATYHKGTLTGYNANYHYIFLGVYPMVYCIRMFDVWLTVLLTIDRVIAVCKPLHASRLCTVSKAYKHMALICLLAFLFSAPRFFEFQRNDSIFKYGATALLTHTGYVIGYRIILFSLVMYLTPMIALVVLNAILLRTIKHAEVHRQNLNKGSISRSNSHSITVIVVVVVSISLLCNSVALVAHLFWSLHQCIPSMAHLEYYRRYIALCANLLITLNSAVNFVVYCLCSRNFRLIFCRTFRCRRKRKIFRSTAKDSVLRSNGTITSNLTFFRFSTRKSLSIPNSQDNIQLQPKSSTTN